MSKKYNAKCKREKCGYKFNSRIVETTGELPKQCPRCKRYDVIEKILI